MTDSYISANLKATNSVSCYKLLAAILILYDNERYV